VVFLLLFLLKPFGSHVDSHTLLVNCCDAGLLTFSTIAFDFFIFFTLFPKFFKEEQWNIGREVIFTILIITNIATANILE